MDLLCPFGKQRICPSIGGVDFNRLYHPRVYRCWFACDDDLRCKLGTQCLRVEMFENALMGIRGDVSRIAEFELSPSSVDSEEHTKGLQTLRSLLHRTQPFHRIFFASNLLKRFAEASSELSPCIGEVLLRSKTVCDVLGSPEVGVVVLHEGERISDLPSTRVVDVVLDRKDHFAFVEKIVEVLCFTRERLRLCELEILGRLESRRCCPLSGNLCHSS